MSMLGRQEIIDRLINGSLIVSPILSAEQIGAASIDLRMGNIVLMVRSRGASHVSPSHAKEIEQSGTQHAKEFHREQKHQRYEIPFETRFLLHPGALALVPTLEWVSIPSNLMGSVTARSTWAREGLSIATATLIEPNYEGIVTLELANLGEIPIALYPGMSLAQIAFSNVSGSTKRPNKPQFSLSFEPMQGKVAKKDDFAFIPKDV